MRQPTAALAVAVICVLIRNNVIIDINTCSANPADSALKIADQIAAKVTARW
jgi:hypothetical protein